MVVDVTAVVVAYNSERDISGVLDSLPAAMGALSFRVVVVDNGSTDGTVSLLESRADCVLVRSSNVGYGAGVNTGVAHGGRSRSVLVLNPDAALGPLSVESMFKALALEGVGIVAPHVSDESGSLFRSLRRTPTLGRASGLAFTGLAAFSEYVSDPAEYERAHAVDWALGAVLLISRICFDHLDGFDESYFLYSEETDLCLRARDAGWLTWYTPEARVTHAGGGSGRNDWTHSMQIINRVRLYRRRHDDRLAWLYFGLTILSEITWVLRGNSGARASLRALICPAARPPELHAGRGVLPT
ncbi:glycosyltransferase family 2 protein [Georgenia yuyongxinii]